MIEAMPKLKMIDWEKMQYGTQVANSYYQQANIEKPYEQKA